MLVTAIKGDCPSCKRQNCFGNVGISQSILLRGCQFCNYHYEVWLPDVSKKVLYVDQFFFSNAFKRKDARFVEAATLIKKLADKQLVVTPYSQIHKEESIVWNEELYKFIKRSSRGHKFKLYNEVEKIQLRKSFKSFLEHGKTDIEVIKSDAFAKDIHQWDDFIWFDVQMPELRSPDEIQTANQQGADDLLSLLDRWQPKKDNFDEVVELETRTFAEEYSKYFCEMSKRLQKGDLTAILYSPVIASYVKDLFALCPDSYTDEQKVMSIFTYFSSNYFASIPYVWISSRMYAILREQVQKSGAYKNRERARSRLSGFHNDVSYISRYAPYCDAIIVDTPMAEILRDKRLDFSKRYGVQVFSLRNWESLKQWLDEIESTMTEEHKNALIETGMVEKN